MRYKFLRWLREKVFKSREGEAPPKLLLFIYRILFPLHFFYQKQSHIRYDPLRDVYYIRGMKITGIVFEWLRDAANKGEAFRLVETDGQEITIERIYETSYSTFTL